MLQAVCNTCTRSGDYGTYSILQPCVQCPADAKLQASFRDKEGRLNKLCAKHAAEAGVSPRLREAAYGGRVSRPRTSSSSVHHGQTGLSSR